MITQVVSKSTVHSRCFKQYFSLGRLGTAVQAVNTTLTDYHLEKVEMVCGDLVYQQLLTLTSNRQRAAILFSFCCFSGNLIMQNEY